jgi:WD40 repeat protein
VNAVAWNLDGTRLASASFDGTARISDAGSGLEIAILGGHDGPVSGVQWNPSGTRIVTAGLDGTARVYYVPVKDLLEAACLHGVRNMTVDEWQRYMGDAPREATCPGLASLE